MKGGTLLKMRLKSISGCNDPWQPSCCAVASMGAFAAGNTDSVQTASASDVTYIENHSVIDCGSYYTEGTNYCFLIKIPNGSYQ